MIMKKSRKNKKTIIAVIILCVLALLSIGSFFMYQQNLKPKSDTSERISFEVKQGDSMTYITKQLEKQKIIRSAVIANVYSRLHNLDNVKAGNFLLDSSWGVNEILAVLNNAKNAKGNDVTITFREGIWAKDIAVELEKQLGISADQLIRLWNDDAYIKSLMKTYEFLEKDVLNDQVRVKLEGYLFPETYSFAKDADAKTITKTFLDHFQTVYNKYKQMINDRKTTIHDVITLASIVQYEASTSNDMKKVAGVFYNRMEADMNLGSSVTVCYALYDQLKNSDQCEVNTDIDSPYNTYLYKGLPIGPIENPGEEAINAVLNPEKSDYLYFVADVYGDGKVYYSRTLEEQEANIDKYHLRK